MSELPLPPATRDTWQAYVHAQNVQQAVPGSEYTFLPPQTALSDESIAIASLVHAAKTDVRPNGTLHAQLVDLRNSPHWNDWAGERPTVPGNDVAAQEYLQGRARQVEDADRLLKQEYLKVAALFETGVRNGIAQGYIPKDVEVRIRPATTETALQVVDPMAYETQQQLGEYETDSDKLTLSERFAQAEPDMLVELVVHELKHKLSGGRFSNKKAGQPQRQRLGFMDDARPDKHVGLTELIDQQVTLGIITGDFATIDPDKREGDRKLYYAYRKLFADCIEKASGQIDLKVVTRSSFEDSDDTNFRLADRRTLVSQFRAAYGPDALSQFHLLCREANPVADSDNPADQQRIQQLMRRIEAPVMRADGSVLIRGYIDA